MKVHATEPDEKSSVACGYVERGRMDFLWTHQRSSFVQTEKVESKLNGLLLAIDGLGIDSKSDSLHPRTVHSAFAVFSYDSGMFEMRAYRADGAYMR